MRVFILGFMGSGKTTLGKKLAHALGMDFIDLDGQIENERGFTIAQIMQQEGIEKFREYEKDALENVIANNGQLVVSTGGGTPCFFNNMGLMNNSGITIYLEVDVPTLVGRLMVSKSARPLIMGKTKEETFDFTYTLLQERQIFYNQAKHIVKGKDIKLKELKNLVKKYL